MPDYDPQPPSFRAEKLTAVEAVLKLADDWDSAAAKAEESAERAHDDGHHAAATVMKGRAAVFRLCATALREAVTAELAGTGKEAGDDEHQQL